MFTRRNKAYFYSASAVACAILFLPWQTHHSDFRGTFSQGVSVSAHKSSPAYAAFEDSREDYAQPKLEFPPVTKTLAFGETLKVETTVVVHEVALRGMTVRAPAVQLDREPTEAEYFAMAGHTTRMELKSEMPDDSSIIDNPNLPYAERRRRLVEQLQQQDWAPPTPSSVAQALVQKTLQSLGAGTTDARSVRSRNQLLASNADRSPSDDANLLADNSDQRSFSSAMFSVRNPVPANMRPLWLSGQVEMTGGLAFTGPQNQMVIKRVFDGKTLEVGHIWVTEGKFEIRVNQPTGFLVAELRTSDGRVLGRGEMSLLDLTKLPKEDRINDIRLALRPTTDGVAIHAISGYSHGSQKISAVDARIEIQAYSNSQKVNDEGIVTEPTLSRDSSFVARALAKDSWPSLIVGQARDPQEVRLFATSLVDALINLNLAANDRKEAHQMAIIWGVLAQNGKPLENARVEMAGNYQPIYFNEMYLPDPKMTGTSKNGLFAFVRVRNGVQALRVRVGEKLYPAQIFPTEDRHVSYVELNVRDKAVSQFRVFDGLNMNKPVRASLRLVGTEESLTVSHGDFVEYATAANPFMIEADAGMEYEVSRVTVTGSPHVVHIPLVAREWLYKIAAASSINQESTRGIIVGYMDDHDFEVELTGYAPGQKMQIVYFNAQGETIASRAGVAGGGFIIFNAPQGLQTLYVHPAQSRETFSQVVVAEPQFVQVVTH